MDAPPETPVALLLRRWAQVATAGALRSNADETRRRRLPGELGVLVQFNAAHAQNKRPADTALAAPQWGEAGQARPAFDFTRARPAEFLAGVAFPDAHRVELFELDGDSVEGFRAQAASVVLANASPLMRGHSLFLLDWALVRPQRLERDLLERGIRVAQAVGRDDFALGFNSAGAWSSVNHFHFQGFIFPPPGDADPDRGDSRTNFPVTSQPRADLFRVGESAAAQLLPQWPMACYAVGATHDGARDAESAAAAGASAAEAAWGLVRVLQQRGIPHNVLVTSTRTELVVWLFPRQPQRENGARLFGSPGDGGDRAGRLRFAIAEVAGLVVAGDSAGFRRMTEDAFTQILRDEVSISPQLAAEVEREWKAAVRASCPFPHDG